MVRSSAPASLNTIPKLRVGTRVYRSSAGVASEGINLPWGGSGYPHVEEINGANGTLLSTWADHSMQPPLEGLLPLHG